MQVFVPFAEPIRVARALDAKRLHKQIVECGQILDAIDGKTESWKNHPVTKMYAPYREWLDRYRICLRSWWAGEDAAASWWSQHADNVRPPFLSEEFCNQHKRRLFTKDPDKYSQFAEFGRSDENWYFVDGQIMKYIGGKKV